MKPNKGQTIKLAKRLLNEHVKCYSKHLLGALICMCIAALATAIFPYFLKPSFDFVFGSKDRGNLLFFCICILLSFLVKGIASYGESVIMLSVGQKIIFDIQERLLKHLLNADLSFFYNINSGDLLSRFSNDVNMMRTAVSTTIVGIGKDFLTLIFLICVMFHRDSMLATFAFIIFPSLIIPISVIGRRMKRVVESTQDNLGTFSGYLSQIFQGIRIVKAYNAEDFESKRARNKMDTLFKLIVRSAKIKSSLHPLSEFICGLAIVVVLSYGDFQITHGYKTAGDLISFLAALLFSYDPLKKLTHLSANLQEGLASANRIFRILDTKPRVKSLESHNYLAKEVECIEFKNVCFSYDPSRNVLDNVTFSVLKSQTVALVGKSGTGKSTILNLLSRFYDPTGGEIRINGANIKALPLQHLRNLIAIVTQETILFDASFYDNIAYGNPTASKEDILAASKAALADDFISKTPYGYDTIIGENGIRISGGQRQRIAIARAMLKNAPVLLLDEATSSLDSNSEKAVQVALEELMKNRTTLVVTHRLSTIIDANMIYVLDDGKIIENGSHSDLIFMKGAYYKFWNMRN